MHDGLQSTATISAAPSSSALLIVDMISPFDFEDGEKLYEKAIPVARKIAEFKSRAKAAGMPIVYVNDNFGLVSDDFGTFVLEIEKTERGSAVVDAIAPEDEAFHILKPHRSGFYATPLGVMLFNMNVSNVIVTGLTTDICVLFTAHDAYMRGFHVYVPADCVTAVEKKFHDDALDFIERVAEANIAPSHQILLDRAAALIDPCFETVGSP